MTLLLLVGRHGCGERIRELGLQSHMIVITAPHLPVALFVFQAGLHERVFGTSSNGREKLCRNGEIGF